MEPADDAVVPEPRAERPRGRILRRLLRSFVSADSYGLVLLLVILTYALSASLGERWGAPIVLLVQAVTVWFVIRTSRSRRGVRIAGDLVLACAAIAAVAIALTGDETVPSGIFMASGLLYLIAPFTIVHHLVLREGIDLETMLGAIATYLLIGMTFAFVYRFLGAVQAEPFFGSQGPGTIGQTLFFSMTTLTTTGYGNLVPASNPGQSMAVLEMVLGQLFLITTVGSLVSQWRPGSLRAGGGRGPESG